MKTKHQIILISILAVPALMLMLGYVAIGAVGAFTLDGTNPLLAEIIAGHGNNTYILWTSGLTLVFVCTLLTFMLFTFKHYKKIDRLEELETKYHKTFNDMVQVKRKYEDMLNTMIIDDVKEPKI